MIQQTTKTLTVEQVDLLCCGISDWEKRIAGTGIFEGCEGKDSIKWTNYDEEYNEDIPFELPRKTIEKRIFEEFRFRAIGFETFQEFRQHFVNTWNRHYYELLHVLKNNPAFSLEEENETHSETASGTQTTSTSNTATIKYSNTPNQYDKNTYEGTTALNDAESSGSGTANSNGNRDINKKRYINLLEKWLYLSDKFKNPLYVHFIDKFEKLFATTVVFNNFF